MVGHLLVPSCRGVDFSIGNMRRTSIANAKKRMLPVARKNVANANGSKSENWPKHVNVISKPNSITNIELLEPQGYPPIPLPVTSPGPSRHIRQEDSSQDKGPFPLTSLQGFFRISDRYLLTTGAASSQVSVPYPHTKEGGSSRASVLYPRTTEEGSSPAKGLSPHTSPAEHFLVSALSRPITAADHCQATSLFLLTCLGVLYRTPTDLSPLTSVVVIFQELPLPPHTTPTRTMGLHTMRLRGEWAI